MRISSKLVVRPALGMLAHRRALALTSHNFSLLATIIAQAIALTILLSTISHQATAQAAVLSTSARPTVSIGREGDTKYEFTRVTRAIELPGRQLVVADIQSTQLRVFGEDGRFVRTLGRNGSGPGEFRNVSLVGANGDTLLIWDRILSRVTRYFVSGTLISTTPIRARERNKWFDIVSAFRDGRWLVVTAATPTLERNGPTYRDSTQVGVLDAAGTGPIKWTGTYPGPVFWLYRPTGDAGRALAVGVAAFSPWTYAIASNDHVLLANGSTSVVDVLTDSGALVRRIRVPLTAKSISNADIRRFRDAELRNARVETERPILSAKYERDLVPSHTPVYSEIMQDIGGEFWVQEFSLSEDAPTRCVGLLLSGRVVGEIRLPPRSRLLFVGRDFVWSVVADEDGVEVLQRRSLSR